MCPKIGALFYIKVLSIVIRYYYITLFYRNDILEGGIGCQRASIAEALI